MSRFGIVVIGYKNVKGIKRLLDSISNVDYEGDNDIKLIISIDHSDDYSVVSEANEYQWLHGEKIVVTHTQNLGLRKHILSCGDYLTQYDLEAIAVLEDDIYVSPEMYKYMKHAVDYYKDDANIAGISLYKHEFNINAQHPFDDYYDGGDTFFIQYAMSWGQVWMRDQWLEFKKWYDNEEWKKMDERYLPINLTKWKKSWLKYHIMYCIDRDLYFVYPRVSLTTNFTDVGVHNSSVITSMQVKLCMKKTTEWKFSNLDKSLSVYDAFFESKALGKKLGYDNLEVDLYGVKKYAADTKYVLTRLRLPYKVLSSWGLFLRPVEANVLLDIPGNDIYLYDLSVPAKNKNRSSDSRIVEYDLKGVNLLCIGCIHYCWQRIKTLVKIKVKKIRKRGKNE